MYVDGLDLRKKVRVRIIEPSKATDKEEHAISAWRRRQLKGIWKFGYFWWYKIQETMSIWSLKRSVMHLSNPLL